MRAQLAAFRPVSASANTGNRPRRARCAWTCALLLALAGLPAGAQDPEVAAQRKIGLLQQYLISGAAQRVEASGDAAAIELLGTARSAHESAAAALAGGRVSEAEDHAREGLRAFSRATVVLKRVRPAAYADDPARNARLRKEIEAHRAAFMEGAREKGPQAAALLDTTRFDHLLKRAEDLEGAQEGRRAAESLREARDLLVLALARLRQNDTVVYSLDFRTPADEYRYELERNRGYELLVQEMQGRLGADKTKRVLVQRFLDLGRELAARAAELAAVGDHKVAIERMEEANKNLIRALQYMGVPVSG